MAEQEKLPERVVDENEVVFMEHTFLVTKSDERRVLTARMNQLTGEGEAEPQPVMQKRKPLAQKSPKGTRQTFGPEWRATARPLPETPREESQGNFAPHADQRQRNGDEKANGRQKPFRDHLAKGVFPTAGLALSGGGIRSAAFCLGAIQALEVKGCLPLFDYLSTVSGGGYIGTTANLNLQANGATGFLGPLGEKKDSDTVKVIRGNAGYLKLEYYGAKLRTLSIYLRGLIANIATVAAVLMIMAAITLLANPTYASLSVGDFLGHEFSSLPGGCWTEELPFNLKACTSHVFSSFGLLPVTVAILVLLAALGFIWAFFLSFSPASSAGIGSRALWLAILLLPLLLLVAWLEFQPLAVGSMLGKVDKPVAQPAVCSSADMLVGCTREDGSLLPYGGACKPSQLVTWCKHTAAKPPASASANNAVQNLWNWLKLLAAPLFAIVTFFQGQLGNFFKQEQVEKTWTSIMARWGNTLLVWLAAISFWLLVWLCYLYLVYWGINLDGINLAQPPWVPFAIKAWFEWTKPLPPAAVYGLFGFGLLALCSVISPNANSMHRLYRDRLGDAFCFIMGGGQPIPADVKPLSNQKVRRPIQLINTAVNLQNSSVVKERGRKADFYQFSPFHVGSVATGYASTKVMENVLGDNLDVATAVAISGAAFSSNMGSASMKPLAPLLAFLNVRLGYWSPNPRYALGGIKWRLPLLYTAYEALGLLDASRDRVYLTDGGHIENLGLYELLRRRCRLIVVVDAEADEKMNFTSFVKLQEFARIDLGARVHLPWSEIAKTSREAMTGKAKPTAGPHCAIGTIDYDNGGLGILIYVKSSVTGDENDYVREYNRRHETFPHESTGDQMFNEQQFEVYRALGFHIVETMLTGEAVVQTSTGLERLTDTNAKGNGVHAAALLLGIEQQPLVTQPPPPIIHNIKIMP